jgi:hypothetical protein
MTSKYTKCNICKGKGICGGYIHTGYKEDKWGFQEPQYELSRRGCDACKKTGRVLKKIYISSPNLGCDPEFFFIKHGEVVGSEKVIPSNGILSERGGGSKVVRDGVQAEVNPSPSTCRQTLAYNIASCFATIAKEIQKTGEIKVDFSQVVKVTKEEMDTLGDKAKKLGCAPSLNTYRSKATIGVKDVENFMDRSGGGHLHFGITSKIVDAKRLVPMLDLIVGNTCVMIDRDPANAERRKVYGRAGEYRLPKYGIEYRTLSNFWLRDYKLMSMVMGLGRTAISFISSDIKEGYFEKKILKQVTRTNLKNAINNNDVELAKNNFAAIEPILVDMMPSNGTLSKRNMKYFHHFIKRIDEKGLEYWFKEDPMTHWTNIHNTHRVGSGWENFLDTIVNNDMRGTAVST